MESKAMEVDGVPMRWVEQGSGMPVVLVHGIPTSPALWRKVMRLAPDVRMLAWEMVGYGDSIPEGRERDISVAAQAKYLRSWLEAMDLGPAVLVGHDLGGGVVQIAAVENPTLCAGLVLTNSIGYDSWPIPSVRALRAVGGLLSRLPASALPIIFGALLARGHDDLRVAKDSVSVHLAPYRMHDGTAALVRQMRSLDTGDTQAIASELPGLRDLPARVVWGAADPFQKLAYGERLARDLGCPFDPIEGGKHFVPEDHPDRIVDAIRAVVGEARERRETGAAAHP